MDSYHNDSHRDGRRVPLTLYFSPDQLEWLSERAEQQDVPVHKIVRGLITAARQSEKFDSGTLRLSSPQPGCDGGNTLDQLRGAEEKSETLCAGKETEPGRPTTRHPLRSRSFFHEEALAETDDEEPPSGTAQASSQGSVDDEHAPVPGALADTPPSMFEITGEAPEGKD